MSTSLQPNVFSKLVHTARREIGVGITIRVMPASSNQTFIFWAACYTSASLARVKGSAALSAEMI
jgi:hypothetical protein